MINGTYKVLSIKLDGVFLSVGLLTSNSFSENIEMLDTTTRDNGGYKTSTPTTQSYFAYITNLGDSSNIDEFISFNATLEGYGPITESTRRLNFLQSQLQTEL